MAPELPYKADFSKVPEGRTPGGWVNTQGKFGVEKLPDGSFALKKLANDSQPARRPRQRLHRPRRTWRITPSRPT